MAFHTVKREPRRAALVTELRFAIVKTPNGLTGRLKLPPEIVTELGWTNNMRLDVAVGDAEDLGWFSLSVVDAAHRAKLKIQPNGVGVYSSSVLVPEGVSDSIKTYTPEAKIDAATSTLFVKLS